MKENTGWTPLHYAAYWGHYEAFQVIFDTIEDKNPMNEKCPMSPLHLAIQRGYFEICKLIIDKLEDKNPSIMGRPGWTALRMAKSHRRKQIEDYIKSEIEK